MRLRPTLSCIGELTSEAASSSCLHPGPSGSLGCELSSYSSPFPWPVSQSEQTFLPPRSPYPPCTRSRKDCRIGTFAPCPGSEAPPARQGGSRKQCHTGQPCCYLAFFCLQMQGFRVCPSRALAPQLCSCDLLNAAGPQVSVLCSDKTSRQNGRGHPLPHSAPLQPPGPGPAARFFTPSHPASQAPGSFAPASLLLPEGPEFHVAHEARKAREHLSAKQDCFTADASLEASTSTKRGSG